MRQKGFTLIELIIVIALVSAGSFVITSMFISQNRLYRSQNAELDVTSQVRFALDDIDNYVRQATRVLPTYSTYTTSSVVLVLEIQSVNASDQLVPGTYDYIVYYLSSGDLMRQTFADPASTRASSTKQVGSGISNLDFTYNNSDLNLVTEVSTSITASEVAGSQTRSFSNDTKAKLRNY
jgi:prepilin-type N-terminal cleavage/methylation domain-containing protein